MYSKFSILYVSNDANCEKVHEIVEWREKNKLQLQKQSKAKIYSEEKQLNSHKIYIINIYGIYKKDK